MHNCKIIMNRLAHKTLKQNLRFIKKFSIPYSLKVESIIYKSILTLKYSPNSNPIYKKTHHILYRKLIVLNRYHVIYSFIQNTVYIFYITDARRSEDKYFNSLK